MHLHGRKRVLANIDATPTDITCTANSGFNADLKDTKDAKRYWTEVTNWQTWWPKQALYNDRKQFNLKTGRFTAKADGYYLCATQLRLDKADA